MEMILRGLWDHNMPIKLDQEKKQTNKDRQRKTSAKQNGKCCLSIPFLSPPLWTTLLPL